MSIPTRLIGLLAALLTLLVLAPVANAEFSSTPAPGLVTECTDTDNSSEYQNLRELPNAT